MQAPRLPRPAFPLQLACALVITLAVVWWAQRPAAGMYEYDSRYHIRYSELLRHDLAAGRGFSSEFPWWQETFLARRWADKDLLYHLLLMPFTFGDLESGGKAASIIMAVALYLCLFLALRWARAPAPALWIAALLLSSTSLLYRAGIVRSHVAAIAIALLGAAAIVRGSRTGVFVTSAAYGLTHIAWHLLPGIALLHLLLAPRGDRRARAWLPALSIAGTALAVLMSPYFPDNLRLWWVQNVTVPAVAWTGGVPHLELGLEMLPGSPVDLIFYNLGPALFMLVGGGLWLATRDAGSSTTLGAVAGIFLLMALASRRFVEFWAPFSALFAACAAGRFIEERDERDARAGGRRRLTAPSFLAMAAACAAVLLGASGWLNLAQTRRLVSLDPGKTLEGCATWIRDHAPPGQTIFTTSWDEFPELFFTAPAQRYLVGLDPTFMWVTDAARFELWRKIALGRVADIHEPIERTFRCHYVFASAADAGFLERADYDPWLKLETRDPECGVYSLLPGPAGPAVREWGFDGGGVLEAAPRGFVDVQALAGPGAAPLTDEPRCGTVRARLEQPPDAAGRPVKLGISTDDSVKVSLNGQVVFDSTVAAPTLGEALARGRERAFVATGTPGYNDLAVWTCRTGTEWGFYLRILDDP